MNRLILPAPTKGAHTDASSPIMLSFVDLSPMRLRPPPHCETKTNFLPPLPAVKLVLPNQGSVARDHLSSERTWLSYVRTSLSVAGTGVALVQLFTVSVRGDGAMAPHHAKVLQFVRPLGAATILLGLYILAMGVRRFFHVQHALTCDEFPVACLSVLSITGVLVVLVAVTFCMLVAVPRG